MKKILLILVLLFSILPTNGAFAVAGPGVYYFDVSAIKGVGSYLMSGTGRWSSTYVVNKEGVNTGYQETGGNVNAIINSGSFHPAAYIKVTLEPGATLTSVQVWSGNNKAGDSITVDLFTTDPPVSSPEPTPEPEPEPEQPSGDRAILVVTMSTGLEKEFDLSMNEVNSFINWYEAKQTGSGKASYAIDKHDNNKGPFKSRKDYILFDRVLTFEVSEY